MATTAVPTIDLSDAGAASDLAQGLEHLGFVQLVNHGASAGAAAELRAACDRFFGLATDVKRGFVHPASEANRGFRAKGSEALSYSLGEASPPDLFESFNCGPDDRATAHPLMQPTPWPDERTPGFRDAAHRWLGQMADLAGRIDSLIDENLGTNLAASSQSGPDTMACIDYRPSLQDPENAQTLANGQQRMGAHSDYTTFTLLHADPVPGLQIVGVDGSWIDVIPEPGALLLNVGDLLAILTNDRWPSTLHRVVPMSMGCAPQRRSVAYFHYPDLAVELSPLARFGEPRYVPVTVQEHLESKLTAPKNHEPATGANTTAGRTI